jgi:3-oxoacyl-[acyl-carrier protein] reductase
VHPDIEQAFDLSGRVAVITGGARGLGRQTAVTLAQAGASVVVADVIKDGLDETVALVEGIGGKAIAVPTDVTSKSSVDDLARAALDAYGKIDIWVNVAGIIRYNLIVDTPEDELDAVIDVNIKGVYYGCQAAATAMIPRGTGSIINFASTGMDAPSPRISCYALSKAAVAMLTRTLAVEVGPAGIRVNTVAPGWVPTDMPAALWRDADGNEDPVKRDEVYAARAGASPLNMIGEPEDMAWAVLYLASDAARFVTGQVLRPNGGISMP